jgi:hypothetical protein
MIFQGSEKGKFVDGALIEIGISLSADQITDLLNRCRGIDLAISIRLSEWTDQSLSYCEKFGDQLKCVILTYSSPYDILKLKELELIESDGIMPSRYQYAFDFKDDDWFNSDVIVLMKQHSNWGVSINLTTIDKKYGNWFGKTTGKLNILFTTNFFYLKMYGNKGWHDGLYGEQFYLKMKDCLQTFYPDAWRNINIISYVHVAVNDKIPDFTLISGNQRESVASFVLPIDHDRDPNDLTKKNKDKTRIIKQMSLERSKLDQTNDQLDHMSDQWGEISRFFTSFYNIRERIERKFGAFHATNEWVKCWELLRYYDHYSFVRPDDDFRYFDNSSFPGSFIMATNHYYLSQKEFANESKSQRAKKQLDWYGSSLIDDKRVNPLTDEYDLYKRNPDRFLMNEKIDGDVTKLSTIDYYKERLGQTVDLYTSDLEFKVNEYNRQEEEHAHANLGQVLAGLSVLKIGGNMITKQFTCYTPFTISLVAIMTFMFEKVELCKPITSKPDNAETYLVGIGFTGMSESIEDIMRSKLEHFDTETDEMLISSVEFIKEIQVCQSYFTKIQMFTVNSEIKSFRELMAEKKYGDTNETMIEKALKKYENKRIYDIGNWFSLNKVRRVPDGIKRLSAFRKKKKRKKKNRDSIRSIRDKRSDKRNNVFPWEEKFQYFLKNNTKTMCYNTSKDILMIGKHPNAKSWKHTIYPLIDNERNEIRDLFDLEIKINDPKNPHVKVFNIEMHFSYSSSLDKRKFESFYSLGKLHNFVSKKYPKIRVFLHAFNIIFTHGKILLAQSWFKEQHYHVVETFDTGYEFNEFLDTLFQFIDDFETKPEQLYRLFEWVANDSDKNNLLRLIREDMNTDGVNKEYKMIIETI